MSHNSSTDRTPLLVGSPASSDTYGDERGEEPELYNGMPSKSTFVWLMIALESITLLSALDTTIVATLLESISSSFSASYLSSWLGTSYILAVSSSSVAFARLSDIIGRRSALLSATAIFGVGTLGCAVMPSMGWLIACRALAGIGGGGMMSVSSVLTSDLVTVKSRGLYQGLGNCVFGLGMGLGGPIGGFINDSIGWRWAFMVQVPIILLCLLLLHLTIRLPLLPAIPTSFRFILSRIDFLGIFLLAVSVTSILLAFTYKTSPASVGAEIGWGSVWFWGVLGMGVIGLRLFVWVEGRVVVPILSLKLLRQRNPAITAAASWLNMLVCYSMLYTLPIFFLTLLRTSHLIAGSHLLPNAFALALGSVAAGAYMKATGKYWWYSVVMGGVMVGCSGLLMTWRKDSPEWLLWVSIVPGGFGAAGVMTTIITAMIASIPKEDIAAATGISQLFRTTGQILGVSLSAALRDTILQNDLSKTITGPGAEEVISKIRRQATSIPSFPPNIQALALAAYQHALKGVFIGQFVASLVLVGVLMGMREVSLEDKGKRVVVAGEEEVEGRGV